MARNKNAMKWVSLCWMVLAGGSLASGAIVPWVIATGIGGALWVKGHRDAKHADMCNAIVFKHYMQLRKLR